MTASLRGELNQSNPSGHLLGEINCREAVVGHGAQSESIQCWGAARGAVAASPRPRLTSLSGRPCALAIEQTDGISVEVLRHPGSRSAGAWQDARQRLAT
jgi:hypothetical protein